MCVCVESGQEALNKLRAEEFDPIVLDNWMPTMIGTEVAKLIRQFNPTIPIVFYSAAGYEEDKQAAFDTGADVYLTKPLGVDLLLDEVERLLPRVH
jgi:CheY-like chemotaxis protein